MGPSMTSLEASVAAWLSAASRNATTGTAATSACPPSESSMVPSRLFGGNWILEPASDGAKPSVNIASNAFREC
eukprot:2006424-Pleurochrysis_carterae.AAC.1